MKEELQKIKDIYDLEDGIVELVYQFNRVGLKTLYSCQGHDWYKKPYIIFQCEENNLHKLLVSLYNKFSKDNHYLDIGDFYKKCTPMISEDRSIVINNNWEWRGSYWDVEDYEGKINKLVSYLEKL